MDGSAQLRAGLDGDVVEPGSSHYDEAARTTYARHSATRPAAVVRCASVADVVTSVRWAREHDVHLVPRGGGHCLAGWSTTEGVVLDLSALRDVGVAEDGAALVGAGARLAAVYDQLGARGRVVPAGCGATVGIAGLTLGGGLGLLGRRHGLTCDALRAAEVVLADGQVVVCDADRDPELFWALRGAGGGQLGVVTSLELETLPASPAMLLELRWPDDAAAQVVSAWQDWAPSADRDITLNLRVSIDASGSLEVSALGASLAGPERTDRLLAELFASSGPPSDSRSAEYDGMPSLKRSLAAAAAGADVVARTRSRSAFFTDPVPPSVVGDLFDTITDAPDGPRELAFTALGGAYDDVAPEATAYAHRGQRFLLEHLADDSSSWVDRSWSLAQPFASGGVYANFPDADLPDWLSAYHGANLEALMDVKRTYDPDDVFHHPQSVPPAGSSEGSSAAVDQP